MNACRDRIIRKQSKDNRKEPRQRAVQWDRDGYMNERNGRTRLHGERHYMPS